MDDQPGVPPHDSTKKAGQKAVTLLGVQSDLFQWDNPLIRTY